MCQVSKEVLDRVHWSLTVNGSLLWFNHTAAHSLSPVGWGGVRRVKEHLSVEIKAV